MVSNRQPFPTLGGFARGPNLGGGGHRWTRYSLLIEGSRQEEFVDWPQSWTQLPDDAANASQRAEYQREMERWERLKDVEPLDIDDIPEKP
jgi:hypothetical protein